MNPVPDGKCAGDQAECDEDHHAPDKGGRFGDAQNGCAEFECQQTEHGESDATANEIDGRHAPPGIAESAGGGDDHGKGEGGRGEAGDGDGHSGALADSLLELVELLLSGDLANAFFPKFASHACQQEDANRRSASCGDHVEGKSGMVACDQADNEQVVSKRQYEKRRVKDSKNEWTEIAEVKQENKEGAKRMRHGTTLS